MKSRPDLHRGQGLVFLLSMPRSGSTVFSMMLGSHSAILSPPEPWILLSLADILGVGNLERIPYGEDSALLATVKILNRFPAAGEGPWLGAAIGKAAQARLAGTAPETVLRNLSAEIYAKNLQLSEKRLFVDKTPRYYRVLPYIDKIFPLAKKIFLARNPLDVANSYMTTWGVPIDAICGISPTANSYDFCYGLFQFQKHFSRRSVNKLVIQYETLVKDPKTVLRQVCRFLGVTFESNMLRFHDNTELIREHSEAAVGDPRATKSPGPLDAKSIDRWRAGLRAEDKGKLAAMLGPEIFVQLGYPRVPEQLNADGIAIPTAKAAENYRKAVIRRLTADGKQDGRDRTGVLERMANGVLVERSSQAWLINKLDADLSAASAERNELRTTSERTMAEKSALEQDRNVKAESLARLSADLTAVNAELGRQRQASEALAAEKVALEQDRNAKAESMGRLSTDLAAVNTEPGRQRQENEDLAAGKAALERDRVAQAEAIGRLTAELSAANADRQELRRRGEQQAAERAALDAAHQALVGENRSLTDRLSALEQNRNAGAEALARASAELEGFKDKLRTLAAEAEALRVEENRLEQKSMAALKLASEARAEANALREAMIWQTKSHAERTEKLLGESRAEVKSKTERAEKLTAEMRAEAKSDAERAEKLTAELRAELNALRDAMIWQAKSHSARATTIMQWLQEVRGAEQKLRTENGSLSDQLQSAIEQINTLTAWVHEARASTQRLQAAYDRTLTGGIARMVQRLRRTGPRVPGKSST